MTDDAGQRKIPLASARGRWLVTATILGSGVAFLDGSVVNVALPKIGADLGGGFSVLQWVLDGYLLTLSSLLLLGGALGDRYGRKQMFMLGLIAFTVASLGCGLAPDGPTLIIARLVQGVGGALLVPGSLALIDASIRTEDRGRAIGAWAGLTGVASAVGPFFGGWLVDAASWRWVFYINVPVAALALAVTARHVPETRDPEATGRPDLLGSAAITIGLAGVVYALIEGDSHGWSAVPVLALIIGIIALVAFPFIELHARMPVLPLSIFRSRQFTGANITTFTVYAALGGAFFLLTLQLQQSLGYSALESGIATLPITVIMLLLSSRIGALAGRIGPRLLMTIGPIVAGTGLALMSMATPGSSYVTGVLPGVVVFGLGLSMTVAPLTSAVLAGVEEEHVGAASGANNAISRLAGLLSVAVLPPVAGLKMDNGGGPLGGGYGTAMWISAILCAAGGLIALVTIDRGIRVQPHTLPSVNQGCQAACTRERALDQV